MVSRPVGGGAGLRAVAACFCPLLLSALFLGVSVLFYFSNIPSPPLPEPLFCTSIFLPLLV